MINLTVTLVLLNYSVKSMYILLILQKTVCLQIQNTEIYTGLYALYLHFFLLHHNMKIIKYWEGNFRATKL